MKLSDEYLRVLKKIGKFIGINFRFVYIEECYPSLAMLSSDKTRNSNVHYDFKLQYLSLLIGIDIPIALGLVLILSYDIKKPLCSFDQSIVSKRAFEVF